MTEEHKPNLPRQDAFAFLNELLARGHFSARDDVQEALQMLQNHLALEEQDAQALFMEWMALHGRVYKAGRG